MTLDQKLHAAAEDARRLVGHLDAPPLPSPGRSQNMAQAIAAIVVLVGVMFLAGVASMDERVARDPSTLDPRDLSTLDPRDPSTLDPCDLLLRAAAPDGTESSRTFPHAHGEAWGAAACALGWDGSWQDLHLLVRLIDTSFDEAFLLLDQDLLDDVDALHWVPEEPGVWVAEDTDRRSIGFHAVAISEAPYFFIVTRGDAEQAWAVAQSVKAELRESSRGDP